MGRHRGCSGWPVATGGNAHTPSSALARSKAGSSTAPNPGSGTTESGSSQTRSTGVSTRMNTVDVPALVVWGMADRVFKPSLGRRLAEAFNDAQFVEARVVRTFV